MDDNHCPRTFVDTRVRQLYYNLKKCFRGIHIVGKSLAKLERTERSWKEPSEVEKHFLKLESFAEVGKFRRSWKVLLRLESSD